MVFETFEHKIDDGHVIDHFVSDKNMNNIGNLTEMTVHENNVKAYMMDGKQISYGRSDVEKIVQMKLAGYRYKDISTKLGFNESDGPNKIRCLWNSILNKVCYKDIYKKYNLERSTTIES